MYQAKAISSNQQDVHDNLLNVVEKHKKSTFSRPIAEHSIEAFKQISDYLDGFAGDVVIDACCGVGESTKNLAKLYPNKRIIGIDKSIARLSKHHAYIDTHHNDIATELQEDKSDKRLLTSANKPNNYILVRGDLIDIWRQFEQFLCNNSVAWKVSEQYILYPNPYPKKSQLGKRWHAMPVFPTVIKVCPKIVVRSNWQVYLNEFAMAAQSYGLVSALEQVRGEAFTPFERKYLDSEQACYQLIIRASGSDR